MILYQKYRPETLDDFFGSDKTIYSLRTLLEKDIEEFPHSIMFTGPSGCGKTTLARIVADSLNCSKNDFQELNSADFRGIDTVRDIIRKMRYRPTSGPCRVWLIDECHKLSPDAQEAILKPLEDTPEHIYFILATTEPEKLKKTMVNRCTQFPVEELSSRLIIKLLNTVLKKEKKEIPDEVKKQIAKDSLGSPRMALVILDKIIDLNEEDMLNAAKQSAEEENEVIDLCRALMKEERWEKISKILKGISTEPESVRRMVLGYCNTTLLNSSQNDKAADIIAEFSDNFFYSGNAGLTLACYNIIFRE